MKRRAFFRLVPGAALVAAPAVLSARCSDEAAAVSEAKADVERAAPDGPAIADIPGVAKPNARFAWDIYRHLPGEANRFFSPYSVSQALAMTFAGARGETAAEMATALRFDLGPSRLHPAFNAFDLALTGGSGDAFRLTVANSAWGQKGKRFEADFLDTLARYYGAGMHLVDFAGNAEKAREAINEWVEDRTEDLIQDLLPRGSVNTLTRLVLTDAIYFKADWEAPFEKASTRPADFHRLDGGVARPETMHREGRYAVSMRPDLTCIELPYKGGAASMVILMPPEGAFDRFEAGLDAAAVETALAGLAERAVALALPRWKFSYGTSLKEPLQALGMKAAFVPDAADFSGMDGTRSLYTSDVVHKAFVRVDEKGTEAAAATGVVVGTTSAPVEVLRIAVDRPFVFLIRERTTGAVLFAGRVLDPAQG